MPRGRLSSAPSKSKDAAITLGPWLVTADEVADRVEDGRLALRTEVRLNGERVGGDVTSNMAWSFAELVAHASRGTVVRPGDVLGSGTCSRAGSSSTETRPSTLTFPPSSRRPRDTARSRLRVRVAKSR